MTHWTKAAVLCLLLLVCGSGFVITQHLREQVPPPAPHDLFAIVNQQLVAFRASDFQAAYGQAATGVQQRFTLPQFEKMVRQRYPEMVRGHRVEFGIVKAQGATALVQVFLLGVDGTVRSFLYSFIHEEKSWKIDGVEELRAFHAGDRLAGTHA